MLNMTLMTILFLSNGTGERTNWLLKLVNNGINCNSANIHFISGSFVCTTCHHYGEWSSLRKKVLSDAKLKDL